jgi:m7GpppX diphosphatase
MEASTVYKKILDEQNKIITRYELPTSEINDDNISDLKIINENERYITFSGTLKAKLKINKIIGYTKEDYDNFIKPNKKMELETYQNYTENKLPLVLKSDRKWILNIIEGKNEAEKIIYSDDKFLLLPDNKFNESNMYYLAIVRDTNLYSIRELTHHHLTLLTHIRDKSFETIEKITGVSRKMFRSYFHYYPSTWLLHIHFNLITDSSCSSSVEHAHSLTNVIENITLMPHYYQKVKLEIEIN